jgi:4'-phosphopantetheinyl transferase
MTRLDLLPGVAVWWSAHTVLAQAVPHPDDVAEAAGLVPLARGPCLYRRTLLRGALAGAGIAGPVSFARGARGGVLVRARDAAPFVSMASTRAMSACALSWDAPVGIDVESIADLPELDALLTRLHPAERRKLASLPREARVRAFHQLWTAKEAWVKASGMPIDRVLTSCGFGLDDADGRSVWTPPTGGAARVSFFDAPGHAGCVVQMDGDRPDVSAIGGQRPSARSGRLRA